MNYSSYTPYGVAQPVARDARSWMRVMRAKLRRIFEFWGASRIDAHFPPC